MRWPIKEAAPACDTHDHPPPRALAPAYGAAALDRAAQLFRAMGDTPRLRILEMLTQQERCVTEIVEQLNEKFPSVSQRLRILRTEGLISRRRAGTHIYYALADRHVADLLHNALAHAVELQDSPAQAAAKTADRPRKEREP
jgi:DNA-binding transcriptional ArsR family regulator